MIDWKALTKIVDYYKKCGGKADDRLIDFVDGKLAAYYDEFCEMVGEERVMPLLRFYLGRGIEGRSDLKNIESILTFLIELTEGPFSAITFKGDKTIKSILLEGEKIKMARKYNNDWYIKSIDSVVGSIEKNAAYLYSIRDRVTEEVHADVVTLIGKYEALKDRVTALKDAPPESHLAIVDELAKVQLSVKTERRKLLIRDFYASLHSTGKENIFIQTDTALKAAEGYVATPPKGASIPSDSQIVGKMIVAEPKSAIDDVTRVQEYREQCLQLFKSIETSVKAREESVRQLEDGVNDAEKKGKEISQKRQELKRQYENGMISNMQLEREGTKLKMQLDSAFTVYQRKKAYYDALSMKFLRLYEAWESFRTSLEIIVENNSEDTKLIEHFDNIVEALRRFAGFINGIEDDDSYDFSLYQKLVSDVQAELKREIEEVVIITGVEVDPLKPLINTVEGSGSSFILNDDEDPFAPPSAAKKATPAGGDPEDPGTIVEGEPVDADNPFRTIFGSHDED